MPEGIIGVIAANTRLLIFALIGLVLLIALGFAFMTLGTYTIIGILLVLAGLFFMATIKKFGLGIILIILGIVLMGIEYIV